MSDRAREDEILQQMAEFIENAYTLQYNELRDKLRQALSVLKVYADRDNWSSEAVVYVLDGTVSASGDEGEKLVSLLMDTDTVWQYSENGYDLAQSTLEEMGVK